MYIKLLAVQVSFLGIFSLSFSKLEFYSYIYIYTYIHMYVQMRSFIKEHVKSTCHECKSRPDLFLWVGQKNYPGGTLDKIDYWARDPWILGQDLFLVNTLVLTKKFRLSLQSKVWLRVWKRKLVLY